MADAIRYVFGEVVDFENKRQVYFPNVEADEISNSYFTMENGITGHLECSRIFAQRIQEQSITVFCEKGSYVCDFTKPYELLINNSKGSVYEKVDPNKDYVKRFTSEGQATNFHVGSHIASIVDFARKVNGDDWSGYGADFEEAYKSQILCK